MATDRHQAPSYPLRMPDELKAKVQAAAASNGRSVHSELLTRIEESFALRQKVEEFRLHGSTALGMLEESREQIAMKEAELRAAKLKIADLESLSAQTRSSESPSVPSPSYLQAEVDSLGLQLSLSAAYRDALAQVNEMNHRMILLYNAALKQLLESAPPEARDSRNVVLAKALMDSLEQLDGSRMAKVLHDATSEDDLFRKKILERGKPYKYAVSDEVTLRQESDRRGPLGE